MQTLLRILSLFQVLICVEMKSQSGNVFTGTEGGRVEIYCNYPGGYQFVSHYFCRHPCGYSDVLIKTEKAGKVTSKGRYSILNTASAQSLSVTIRNLRLGDSGIYYCGVESWGLDKLTKVVVTVRNVTSVTTAPLSTLPTIKSTYQSSTSSVTQITADNNVTSAAQSTFSSFLQELPLYGGGVLGLLLCCVLVAFVVLYRRLNTHTTSLKPPTPKNQISDPPPDQDNIFHVYDEMLAVYSLADPTDIANSSEAYSVIQHAPPAEEDCSLYSLIAPH